MKEKNKKELKSISSNKMLLAAGICLVMLTFVLIMDVGYTARTINFLFYFPFGFGAYIIYFLMLVRGVMFVFSSRQVKLKHKWWIYAGSFVILLGISSIISLTSFDGELYYLTDFSSSYVKLFASYYDKVTIRLPFLFKPENGVIGGGYLGYFISALFNSIAKSYVLSIVLSILFIVIGILVGALPFIISYAKNYKKNKKSKIQKVEKQAQEIASHVSSDDFYTIRDQSKEIIRNASKIEIEPMITSKRVIEDKTMEDEKVDMDVHEPSRFRFSDSGISTVGGLTPAHFQRKGVSFETHRVETLKNDPMQEVRNINIEPDNEIINNQENKPIKETVTDKKPEQIHLNFDEAPVLDEKPNKENNELLTAKPEFDDPIVVKKQEEYRQPSVHVQTTSISNQPVQEQSPIKIKHKFIEPSLDLLNDYETGEALEKNNQTAEQRMLVINNIFNTFNVHAQCIGYVVGPSVTRYNIAYTETAQFKSVNNLTNDISIRLGGVDARFEAIVPGETYSGLEISNAKVTMVGFKEVLQKLPPREKHPLAVAFGKNISGEVIWADLNKMPHMLIAGTTGSGKSIFIHSVIMTLIMRNNPDDLRLVLVDPKRVEMSKYKNMPHLLCPNITEPEQVTVCLNKLVDEMERRYSLLENNYVSDIGEYNELCEEHPEMEKMPYYVAILDEYSDLVDRAKDLQRPVISLAQKARACGIHLIICTQRPSTNVITGLVKGNLPTHVALMTSSSVDSMTIIGEGGAEKLLGKGDMLVQSAVVSKVGCVRLQGCYVANKEILKVVEFLKSTMTTDYHPDFLDLTDHSNDANNVNMPYENGQHGPQEDEAYDDVKDAVMCEDYISISKIQRQFGFGFNRASRIFEQLVDEGVVEKPNQKRGSSLGCKVLLHDDYFEREANVGSDEVTTSETLDEYMHNADNADGSY